MLDALKSPGTPEQIAQKTGLPLFRVRSGLRELVEAGMVSEQDGNYLATAKTTKQA
jgi:DNA-binding IclR family transcriptional regulator